MRRPASTRGLRLATAEKRYLTFVDILGFKSLIGQARNDPDLARDIEDAVDEALYWVKGHKPHPTGRYAWKLKTFSDNLTFSQPDTPLGLLNMFEAVGYLVRRMIARSLPVRGAIVLDDHIQFRLTMPSAAVAAAYEMEQVAVYPRILLAPRVVESILADPQEDLLDDLSVHVAFDQDECAFLNHLIVDDDDDLYFAVQFLEDQWHMIYEKLHDTTLSPEIRRKFRWLGAFHNWCVRSSDCWKSTHEDDVVNGSDLMAHGCLEEPYKFTSLWHMLQYARMEATEGRPILGNVLANPDLWPFNDPPRWFGRAEPTERHFPAVDN